MNFDLIFACHFLALIDKTRKVQKGGIQDQAKISSESRKGNTKFKHRKVQEGDKAKSKIKQRYVQMTHIFKSKLGINIFQI